MASDAAVKMAGDADGESKIEEKIRLKAFGRKAGRLRGSWRPILVRAEESADKYVGMSDDLMSGGEERSDSMIVGRLFKTAGLAPMSIGGGASKWASRE